MIDPPRILQTAAQRTAVLAITCLRSEVRNVMGPGLKELRATLAAQGIEPTGPWFTHHLRAPGETFEFEIGVPVGRSVTPAGRVEPGELPAATVARTIYHGGYEGLATAWGELGVWIAAQGRKSAPSLWETYVTDPSEHPDPSTWRTELTRPLLG